MNTVVNAGLAATLLVCTTFFAISDIALAAEEPVPAKSAVEQAADSQLGDYRQQQWSRLAGKQDRDSLIAAVLLGMPNDPENPVSLAGNDAVEKRLAAKFGRDPDALFALALSCQLQKDSCAHPEYYQALVKLAPDNAVNWLLLPNRGTPDAAQLHSAATASMADSQARMLMGRVRAVLADQPAPTQVAGVDGTQLALMLRRHVADQVSLPMFRSVVVLCKAPPEAMRSDCIELGRHLEVDRSGSILARIIGSVIIRRLEKGTAEEADAKQLRRDYVWMSEQAGWLGSDEEAASSSDEEQLQVDCVALGEWTAWERTMQRAGVSTKPPADWVPKNPQSLLLSEERTPAPAK